MNTVSLLTDAQFFDQTGTKFSELRRMLDMKSDQEKLQAMKRLIAMITLGRDVSVFFPDVVKNVVVENAEVKKFVYMFLIHYAEQNADLALLSINSFQKDLTNRSARVRANAIKAMSSIGLRVVVPLVHLALQTVIKDSSPYVRKAAAHAIPKVFALDPSQKPQLVSMIETLLENENTDVLGSALFAFHEVCPERLDLLHPHFRKICQLLADLDEWAQTLTLGILLHYGRTQFVNPALEDGEQKTASVPVPVTSDAPILSEEAFYADAAPTTPANVPEEEPSTQPKVSADHKLMLKSASLLLHSKNAGVVLGVAALFLHLGAPHDLPPVGKPLVRMLRKHKELAWAVLTTISSLATERADIFRVHLKLFFVRSQDPLYVRELKLDVLAKLASESNISQLLRELQFYLHNGDKRFVCATVQTLGRIASRLQSISERCIRLLMRIISSSVERVVAEAVVVIRQLLQQNPEAHVDVIKRMVKLVDTVQAPRARAAIVWLIGEYRDCVPLLAPDALRVLVKGFRHECVDVKLQILNLATKLFLSSPHQTALLFKHVMDLCKYDMSYDIRDRARLLRCLFFKKKLPPDGSTTGPAPADELVAEVKDSLKSGMLEPRPAPVFRDRFAGRAHFTLGTLSHALNSAVQGYEPLPDFPVLPSDDTIRNPRRVHEQKPKHSIHDYSESEESEESSEEGTSSSSSGGESSEWSSDASGSSSGSESGSESESSSDGSNSGSGSSSSEAPAPTRTRHRTASDELDMSAFAPSSAAVKSELSPVPSARQHGNVEDILGALEIGPMGQSTEPAEAPSDLLSGEMLKAVFAEEKEAKESSKDSFDGLVVPRLGASTELLSASTGAGLQVLCTFNRAPSLYSDAMNALNFTLVNHTGEDVCDVAVPADEAELEEGMDIHVFEPLAVIAPKASAATKLHVNFNGKVSSIRFRLHSSRGNFQLQVTAHAGELLRPLVLTEEEFSVCRAKLQGMTAHAMKAKLHLDDKERGLSVVSVIAQRVLTHMNVAALRTLPCEDGSTTLQFSGSRLCDSAAVLLEVGVPESHEENELSVGVYCEDFLFGGHIAALAKKTLS